jgi:transaldolase
MNATRRLHDLGQSLWLDNITRDMLNNGTLKGYIDELSVTGLTSNPTIFDQAIRKSATYDVEIAGHASSQSDEDVFFALALDDLSRAAQVIGMHTSARSRRCRASSALSPITLSRLLENC